LDWRIWRERRGYEEGFSTSIDWMFMRGERREFGGGVAYPPSSAPSFGSHLSIQNWADLEGKFELLNEIQ
jgi:hypothetical protein